MSRIAKAPVQIPAGVQVTAADGQVTVKGAKSSLSLPLPPSIAVEIRDGAVRLTEDSIKSSGMLAGTIRALINNAVNGVTRGYEKKLNLVGVGYRAQAQGKKLNLQVGFSHPIEYPIPEGITVDTPSQTEIVVKGASREMVGRVAAEIRAFRPPEPYKGKGVRYANEQVTLKEAKKK